MIISIEVEINVAYHDVLLVHRRGVPQAPRNMERALNSVDDVRGITADDSRNVKLCYDQGSTMFISLAE